MTPTLNGATRATPVWERAGERQLHPTVFRGRSGAELDFGVHFFRWLQVWRRRRGQEVVRQYAYFNGGDSAPPFSPPEAKPLDHKPPSPQHPSQLSPLVNGWCNCSRLHTTPPDGSTPRGGWLPTHLASVVSSLPPPVMQGWLPDEMGGCPGMEA